MVRNLFHCYNGGFVNSVSCCMSFWIQEPINAPLEKSVFFSPFRANRPRARTAQSPLMADVTITVTKLCGACKKHSSVMKRCSRCEIVNYCDAKCQRADWPVHSKSCRDIRAKAPMTDQEASEFVSVMAEELRSALAGSDETGANMRNMANQRPNQVYLFEYCSDRALTRGLLRYEIEVAIMLYNTFKGREDIFATTNNLKIFVISRDRLPNSKTRCNFFAKCKEIGIAV